MASELPSEVGSLSLPPSSMSHYGLENYFNDSGRSDHAADLQTMSNEVESQRLPQSGSA